MSNVADARVRARRLYPRSVNFQSTYVKGAMAAMKGQPSSACPYAPDPKKTWKTAYRMAWVRGWQSVSGTVPDSDDGR